MEDLNDFDTLLPEKLPANEFEVSTHESLPAVARLAEKFELPIQETVQEWKEALIGNYTVYGLNSLL